MVMFSMRATAFSPWGYIFANDCCDQLHFPRNPFIPVDSKDPSLDQLKQRKLVQSFWSNSNTITVQVSSSLYFLCLRLDQGRMRGECWLEKAQKHTSWGQSMMILLKFHIGRKYNESSCFWGQGCISCGILVSGIRARGVSSEHMENMEMFSCSPT